ncbi:hypothetical protein SPI_07636 [Niveomyces insectorum RCEF 264]|uniref:DUF300 domain containing protein n=1 Tax=Niveomyces insectorum RCEF 264 TaxID=1081102 RepID=A0A167PGE1_9HYPO|nr:hypothetical protein SPI_07636 [Niveomyces insectorum RCEF 264]
MVGGTGQKLTQATIIVAGVGSLAATLMSIISIWLQLKNYRKPLLQRYVVRILLMVPIYSIASFSSMISMTAAQFLDPIRDIYEAFTIYTFFQLLINYLDGERALIIMTHGRKPIHHLWPLNHVLPPVDISDPHSFLAIKRGILQYAWLKPVLGLAAIIMKATNTYQESYIGLKSGYFWSGIVYNLSVTISLYSLGLFWVCMHDDLKPFRPVPKFLCVKLIIFASYWQGFFLAILVWLGALPDDVQGYTPDNLAAAIQDALICIEMPAFAVAHWYAFSWKDFADQGVSAARLPVKYALRDAFGVRDLIEDSKLTFRGDHYAYRDFDSNDKIMAHASSRSRVARLKAGMRYERGGKGKYWIPSPDRANAHEADPYTPLLGGGKLTLDPDMEQLYGKARQLEYGDWNYPVIPANVPSREERWRTTITGSYRAVPTYEDVAAPAPAPAPANSNGGSSNKTKRAPKPGEPAAAVVVVSSKKKKGKQKQRQNAGASATSADTNTQPSGEAATATRAGTTTATTTSKPANGTGRAGVDADAARYAALEPPPAALQNADGTVNSARERRDGANDDDDESLRLWRRKDEDDDEDNDTPVAEISPRYELGGDEFRNVWGGGGGGGD